MLSPGPVTLSLVFLPQCLTFVCSRSSDESCTSQFQIYSDAAFNDTVAESNNLMMLQLRSMERRAQTSDIDGFELVGTGCCTGIRNERHGKLWAGGMLDLASCAAKCREFPDCGFVEYAPGNDNPWCFIWNAQQACALDAELEECGAGDGDGVHAYRFVRSTENETEIEDRQREEAAIEAAKIYKMAQEKERNGVYEEETENDDGTEDRDDFEIVGPGCCQGKRDLRNGKLWSGPAADLVACKAKCREFTFCGVIEYGWTAENPWCFIWNDHKSCSLKTESDECGAGGGDRVHTYRFDRGQDPHVASLAERGAAKELD